MPVPRTTSVEPHAAGLAGRLNWLRAGVLGANDGIVSVAGIVVGVAGATPSRGPVFTAGLAGLVAGAVSMALGEYVSVSSQRDSEQALLAKERAELRDMPEAELKELAEIYERKGLRPETARQVAIELTEHDVLTAHAEAELGVHPDDLASPGHAAFASAVAFVAGAAPAAGRDPAATGVPAGLGHGRGGAARAGDRRRDQCPDRRQQRAEGGGQGRHRRRGRPRADLGDRLPVRHRDRLTGPDRRHDRGPAGYVA